MKKASSVVQSTQSHIWSLAVCKAFCQLWNGEVAAIYPSFSRAKGPYSQWNSLDDTTSLERAQGAVALSGLAIHGLTCSAI